MKRRVEKPTLGGQIIAGLEEALAYERGTLTGTKVTRATLATREVEIQPAPSCGANQIVSMRERLRLSQPVFAAALNVSAETVKKWEQGTRAPDGAALRLLELTDLDSGWILERIRSSAGAAASRRGSSKSNGKTRKG